MANQQTINPKLRREIYERDKYTCKLCGEKVVLTRNIKTKDDYKKEATLDHIIPKTKGGDDTKKNLRTACRSCNAKKCNKTDKELKFLNLNKGEWTQIHNSVLSALARTRLNSKESRITMAILLKTYGYKKSKDWISNGQLETITGIDRRHCVNTVTRLKNRKIIIKNENEIKINKYFFEWTTPQLAPKQGLAPKQVLAPKTTPASTQNGNLLAPKQVPTRDNITKDNITKDSSAPRSADNNGNEINQIAEIYYKYNPTTSAYKNTNQRKAIAELIRKHGFEQAKAITEFAIRTQGRPYAPRITTPMQLNIKFGDLRAYAESEKAKAEEKGKKPIKL